MFRSGNEPIRTGRYVRPNRGWSNSLRAELGYPTVDEMSMPILLAIAARNGILDFSSEGYELEKLLAEQFKLSEFSRTYSDPVRFTAKGGRAWRNHIQWARKRLVDLGLVDPSWRGKWRLTEQGWAMVRQSGNSNYRPQG